jgi:hypothetical protein
MALELLVNREGFHVVLDRIISILDIYIPVFAHRTLKEFVDACGASLPPLEYHVSLVEYGTTKRISVPERIISGVLTPTAPAVMRESELIGRDASTQPIIDCPSMMFEDFEVTPPVDKLREFGLNLFYVGLLAEVTSAK